MKKIFKSITPEFRKKEGTERTYTFIASDSTRDSYGTVVNQDGWDLDRYNKNGIVGYQHNVYGGNDPDNVIGKGRAYLEDGKLMLDVEFEPEDVNQLAEKIRRKVEFGSLKAVSVGFIPTGKGHYGAGNEGVNKPDETYYYGGQELLEVSIVNIPANPNAVRVRSEDPDVVDEGSYVAELRAAELARQGEEEERKAREIAVANAEKERKLKIAEAIYNIS